MTANGVLSHVDAAPSPRFRAKYTRRGRRVYDDAQWLRAIFGIADRLISAQVFLVWPRHRWKFWGLSPKNGSGQTTFPSVGRLSKIKREVGFNAASPVEWFV